MGVQTHLLTYGKKPYEKEFLDFSFNGKYISEFGLVAVFDGDRLSFNGSPDFQDEVTSVEGVPGQYFWGTKFKTIKRSFTLVTDGMTEKQLNSFKKHFCPGYYGKFIEDQYMHRYSYCRVANPAAFSIVPFREPTVVSSLGQSQNYTIYTNIYKGEIKLTLEWDEPFYYSSLKYIDDTSWDYNNLSKDIIEESFRAVYNNNIVFSSSWASKFYAEDTAKLGVAILGLMRLGSENNTELLTCHLGGDKKLIYKTDEGKSVFVEDEGLVEGGSSENGEKYEGIMIYYNPSTIESPSKITLRFTPKFTNKIQSGSNWKPIYLDNIADKYNTENKSIPYNTIKASDIILPYNEDDAYRQSDVFVYKYQFHYSNPNVISQLHAAIALAEKYFNTNNGGKINATQFEDELRKEITNDKVLKWAITVLAYLRTVFYDAKSDSFNTEKTIKVDEIPNILAAASDVNWLGYFNILMLCMFVPYKGQQNSDLSLSAENWDWENLKEIVIIFDGTESISKVSYSYNYVDNNFKVQQKEVLEEVCGDMIFSPYLKLGGGNTIGNNGKIESCHCLCFEKSGNRLSSEINYIKLEYDYVYL